jgi:aminoglycoside phosphotransferase (APT) family kinase protein
VQELSDRFAAYVAHQWPDASGVEVTGLTRIHGGASRETYRLRLRFTRDGRDHQEGLILRRDPSGSLIDTDRATEVLFYRAFQASLVPVPRILWLEEELHWLDRPFFVMQEIEGGEASPQALLAPPYDALAERIGQRKWEILAEIHKADPKTLGLTEAMEVPTADTCWCRELDHWEGVLDEDELAPQPIGRAAIRWLRANPPAAAQKLCAVHADYRTGNFLVGQDGEVLAILDWEMAHLGDPLEDLAWSLNRVWHWARDERAGGLLPRGRAIEIWEKASGLRADPEALHWWELFSSVKGLGIWVSSGHEYAKGSNMDPVLGFTSWWLTNAQNRAILETMGKLA